MLPTLATAVPDALANADKIAGGLESGPIRYIAALSLLVNLGLFLMLMRVQSLRVSELKENAKAAEKLGGVLEQHNQAVRALDKAMEFVLAQLPRRRASDRSQEHEDLALAKPPSAVKR